MKWWQSLAPKYKSLFGFRDDGVITIHPELDSNLFHFKRTCNWQSLVACGPSKKTLHRGALLFIISRNYVSARFDRHVRV